MAQNKELTLLPLRLPEPGPDLPRPFVDYMRQYNEAWQRYLNSMACTNLRSGLTKFSDNQNKGYFLGYARGIASIPDGTPVFIVGDRAAEKYLAFDGDDVSIGFNTKFLGADAVNNDKLFRHIDFESLDKYSTVTADGGTVTLSGQGAVIAGNGNNSVARITNTSPAGYSLSWSDDITLAYRFTYSSEPADTLFIGAGNSTGKRIGFQVGGNDSIVIVSHNGTSITATTTSASYETSGVNALRVDKKSDEINFFKNAELIGTITSNIPTGVLTASEPIFVASVEGDWGIVISDAYFVQR